MQKTEPGLRENSKPFFAVAALIRPNKCYLITSYSESLFFLLCNKSAYRLLPDGYLPLERQL
jgi:hypothetical protein